MSERAQRFSEGIERVIEHVRSTRGRWQVGRVGLLRRKEDAWACPLASWRDGTVGRVGGYIPFAEREGLTQDDISAVMRAADGGPGQSALRAALLEAAGLSESAR